MLDLLLSFEIFHVTVPAWLTHLNNVSDENYFCLITAIPDQFRYLHTSNSAGQRWAALPSAAQRCPAALPSAGQRWAALVAAIAILKQR